MRRFVGLAALLVTLVACGGGGGGDNDQSAATTTPGTAPSVAVTPPPPDPTPPYDAWIDVTVATLWDEPDQARPLDAPSLGNPVDIGAWLAAMAVDDRRWLVDRLVTQALYGDEVTVVETAGAWSKVVVLRQPSHLDPRGYPGWLPTAQLTTVPPAPGTGTDAVVIRPAATLRVPDGTELQVSFNTRLPLVDTDSASGVTVSVPGGMARLAPDDVALLGAGTPPATGEDVVRSAQLFSGVEYLWAGTSAAGWDCSGFTHAAYSAHGVVIPRDADDQAAAGTPVDRADLRPGDLLFYGADTVTHVAMYVGDGRMIQAPATGRTVETVSVDSPGLTSRFLAARRYLPEPA